MHNRIPNFFFLTFFLFFFWFFFTGFLRSKVALKQKSPISHNEITDVAKKAFGSSFSKLNSYEFKDYKENKTGYFGHYSQLKLSAQLENGEILDLSLFVKSLPIGKPDAIKFIQEYKLFETESFFYSNLLSELYKDCDIERWAPQPYFANNDIIIMEELKNYSTGIFPLPVQHVRTALRTLARFHASSILTEARLGKPLDKIFPDSFNEKYFNNSAAYQKWILQGVDLAVAIAKKFDIENLEDIKWKMKKIYDTLKSTKIHKKVICRGDVWSKNFMFENNQSNHCIFVDFQMIRYAPLVFDILELICTNANENFTEELKTDLLKNYHDNLQEIITKNRPIDAKIPSFKEVLEAYNQYEYYGKIMAVLNLRSHFLGAGILKKVLSDETNIDMFSIKFKNYLKILINNILNIE